MNNSKNVKIFYDGRCGLCHNFIRFVLSKMTKNHPFFFASQEGKIFKNLKKHLFNTVFYESIIVYNEKKDKVLIKAEAIILILTYLKWPWRGIGFLLKGIPLRVSNFFYDCIAKVRHRLFKKPKNSCPIIPVDWKVFFEEAD